jgi:hypothetical protein
MWYRIDVGRAAGAKARLQDLLDRFAQAFDARGRPAGMAIASTVDTDDHLTLYLTPGCADLARALPDAQTCEVPPIQRLTWIAGTPQGPIESQ